MRVPGSTRAHLLRRAGVAVLVPLLLGLSACGEESGDDASPTTGAEASPSATQEPSASSSPAPDGPACDEVWVDGGRLPQDYAGCQDSDGYVPVEGLDCSSGQFLARYDDRYFGVLGGKVKVAESTLDDDPRYRGSVARCRG